MFLHGWVALQAEIEDVQILERIRFVQDLDEGHGHRAPASYILFSEEDPILLDLQQGNAAFQQPPTAKTPYDLSN